jgi:hypothetical protein
MGQRAFLVSSTSRAAIVARGFVVLALSTAAFASAQNGDCARAALAPQVMTPPAGTIPRDAAILVGMFPAAAPGPDTPVAALRRGRRTIALRSEAIAPGLFRLVPNTNDRLAGSYTVEGISSAPSLMYSRPGRPAPPSAPSIERAERYSVASGGGARTEVRVHVGFPIPDAVAAIVSYWDGDDEPDLFVRAVPQQQSVVVYTSTALCTMPNGSTPPPDTGGSVRIAFVDLYGQISALSEARPIE